MRRIINRRPERPSALLLGALPFLILAALYLTFSALRLAENPNDKLLPALASLGDAISRVALQPEKISCEVVLSGDPLTSWRRLLIGLGLATLIGLVFGLAIVLIPYVGATLAPLVSV